MTNKKYLKLNIQKWLI